ncbi:MAG: hypothetical protein ACXAC5_23885 [Promethearchaeota archaeon]
MAAAGCFLKVGFNRILGINQRGGTPRRAARAFTDLQGGHKISSRTREQIQGAERRPPGGMPGKGKDNVRRHGPPMGSGGTGKDICLPINGKSICPDFSHSSFLGR